MTWVFLYLCEARKYLYLWYLPPCHRRWGCGRHFLLLFPTLPTPLLLRINVIYCWSASSLFDREIVNYYALRDALYFKPWAILLLFNVNGIQIFFSSRLCYCVLCTFAYVIFYCYFITRIMYLLIFLLTYSELNELCACLLDFWKRRWKQCIERINPRLRSFAWTEPEIDVFPLVFDECARG